MIVSSIRERDPVSARRHMREHLHETIRLYQVQRDGIYDLLETVGDVPLKIFLYRLAGKVLKDV